MPNPTDDKTTSHFVAHLKIEKIVRQDTRGPMTPGAEPKRSVEEITQLTIKADTLDGLTEKLGKHIAIIEED